MSEPKANMAADPQLSQTTPLVDDQHVVVDDQHVVVDVDKIDRASSVATSMDQNTLADQTGLARRFSLSGAGHISLDDVDAVDVQIRDLAVSVDTSPSWFDPATYPELAKAKFNPQSSSKTLLHHVSASLPAGTLTAIIGGSGSGKTTLLNIMSERMISTRLSQGGSITFNGNEGVHNARHAYVMQQDILLPSLTVRETLQYSADLRLPPPTTAEERRRIVEEVILELGLKECANTRIGNNQHRGCSGGEKRRVSIGVQLLANPSVVFLDEPTTGLDATSAFQLVRTLKKLATKGRTVITTIHQPRSEIWDLFDNLIILTRGSPVFSGLAKECVPWFEGMNFKLPPFVNPAEYVIDVAAIDNRTPELEEETTARVDRLKAAWNHESQRKYAPSEKVVETSGRRRSLKSATTKHATYGRQIRVLTDRTFKTTYRDPMGMAAAIMEAILMAIITGYIFYDLPKDLSGIRSRQGALYTISGLQGYLMLVFEVYRLTLDIPTYDREHSEHCVDAIPFLLSRRLARLFTEDLPVPFLFSVIFYFMAGFENDAAQFFTFFAITLISHYIAVTCAMTCVTASRNFPGASLIANIVFTLQSMACGYFIQSNSIPVYVRWLKWITYQFYGFGAYCGNEFTNSLYDCPFEGGFTNPECNQYTGNFVMNSLGFPPNWVWRPIVIMASFVVFFCLISAFGLQFIKQEMTIARARVSDTDLSAGKEKMKVRSISEIRTIDVGLDEFALDLDKRAPSGKKLPRKTILNPVNTTFQAGKLNIIMGPSGSGKTSLLNAMALRLRNSIGTRYLPSGKLMFNGAAPSNAVIRSVCSYVCQDDDALLPSLTVRETLRFSAGLRLPSHMSKEEKCRRAEDVLLKMGLKDCADNLVGNELVKGISGGEKRRVTIAVQLLSDPRVLLLDEPTSGLDAFTANSIMEVLHGLANEGRTLILTIHQARSDLFQHFGNVLLLARGGSAAYAGAAKDMLAYFTRQGFECPAHSNPADFALDLITIDLQHEQREAESREKVRKLVEAWRTQSVSDLPETSEKRLPGIEEGEESNSTKSVKTQTLDAKADEAQDAITESPSNVFSIARKSFNKASLATPAELGALVRKRASFVTAFPILLHRGLINFRRQPPLLVARIAQVVSLGAVLALFFAPLKKDYFSVQNRMGFIQEFAAFYFVGMLQNVAVFPAERDVFYREDDDGAYSVEAFLAAYSVLEFPFEIMSSLIFGVLADFAVGLPRTVEMYFVCSFACFGIVSCGESVGIMFNTLFNHTGFAVNIISVLMSVANTMTGIMSIDMPQLYKIFNYLSPIRYAARAVAPYSLRGIEFSCNDDQRLPNGQCPIETGEQVLQLYKFNVNPNVNIAALAGCVIIYRIVAWALLRAARTRLDKLKGNNTTTYHSFYRLNVPIMCLRITPLTNNGPPASAPRRASAWWSLLPAALLLTYLHSPSAIPIPSFTHPGAGSSAAPACRQVDPLFPTLTTAALSDLDKFLDTPKFRNETIARLSGAIQIPTESFDNYGNVGVDDRWDKLFAFSAYLKKTFPKVHEQLSLERINTHGLLYTWTGSDASLKPTVLMAHQDTVPVAPTTIDSWTHPPFSGAYDGYFVWGRGAMDCKNSLIGILESVELLLDAGFAPKRTVLLSFGFDEEISGERGAGHLAPFLIERYGKDGAAILIDEGSGFDSQWGQTFALPGTAEKGYIDVEVVVRTPGGHSSIPPPHTGIGILSELVTKIEGSPYKSELLEGNPYLGKLQCGASYAPEFPSNLKKLLPSASQRTCKRRSDKLAEEAAKAGPQVKYLFTTSVATDIIEGGVKINALPERVRVVVNHRVNVGDTTESVKKHIAALVAPVAEKYNLTLHAFDGKETPSSISLSGNDKKLEPAPVTPTSVEGVTPYGILSGTTRALYGEEVVVSPGIMTGNTDTRYYWDLTAHIFRFLPGYDPESDEWAGIHTVDEKTSVKGHINLVKWYTSFLRNVDEAEFA